MGKLDWDALAGRSAKYLATALAIIGGLITIPLFSSTGSMRLLTTGGLVFAALAALMSGWSMRRRGDPTEGAARSLVGGLLLPAALWFSNLISAPGLIAAPDLSERVGEVIRTAATTRRPTLDQKVGWSVTADQGAAQRLLAPVQDALAKAASEAPVSDTARQVSAAAGVKARAGSLASGQVTASLSVALAAHDAPVCRFSLSTPRPMPLSAAAEWLAVRAVEKTQSYVEGNDAC